MSIKTKHQFPLVLPISTLDKLGRLAAIRGRFIFPEEAVKHNPVKEIKGPSWTNVIIGLIEETYKREISEKNQTRR